MSDVFEGRAAYNFLKNMMFRSSPQEYYHSPWNLLEMCVLGLVFSVVTMGAGVYWWEGARVDKLSARLGQSCTVKGGPF